MSELDPRDEGMFLFELPFPFAGWLDEHPTGGFALLHKDGSLSPTLESEDEVREYLVRVESEELSPIQHVSRIRQVTHGGGTTPTLEDLLPEAKLYPPQP